MPLPKAKRAGPWGIGRRLRQAGDLPLPDAHEVVVYKSGNSYVVDDGRSRPTDAHIANATNISVVDMRENAPVTVQTSIPSAGADVFAVQVTFLCTVRKPEDVVDSGLTDMADPLTQYLARHQPLFHVGEDHEFDDITVVRRNVTAEVKAYISVRPPRFRGMEVGLGNVQVLTPTEIAELEKARRERRREGLLTSEGQRQEHFLAREREEHQQVMDVLKQRYQHDLEAQAERNREELAEMKRRLDEDRELQLRRHEQLVAEMRHEFEQAREQRQFVQDGELRSKFDRAIAEAGKLAHAIGADRTEVPSLIAASAGERTIAETADLLGEDRREERDAMAADSRRRETWDREDDRARWQAEREDARFHYQLKAEQLSAELAVFGEAIKRGHCDAHTIDQLAAIIDGAVKQLENASAAVSGSAPMPPVKDQTAGKHTGTANVIEPEHKPDADDTARDTQLASNLARFLVGRFPDTARPGQVFSLLVWVVISGDVARQDRAPLKPFTVPPSGKSLTLIIDAPGLRVAGEHRQTILVPSAGDSEPVRFDLIGDNPGPRRVSVTAWDGGSYLGELGIEISIERDSQARPDREARSAVRAERTEGEVTLLVRYDRRQAAYRFEFIDVDYPDEVTSQLVYDPGPAIEQLVRRLDTLAENTTGYSAEASRAYLVSEGVQLWQELVPDALRSQFWERQHRITQLTILASQDVVPWELLYPKDRRHDAGFLVEQFPVTRAIFGCARQRQLRLHPARFVVPTGSPADARAEAEALAGLLGTKLSTISELTPLLHMISKGRFGLLHFACHSRFDPDTGSSIKLDGPFNPTFLATAAAEQALARSAPVVFINACRSLGKIPSYSKLDGWADKFMHAGAAAFIGSLWEVSDGMAREFAMELYRRLADGDTLGQAVMSSRRAIAAEPGDPTWLAYAVYGDPQAKVDLTAI